MLHIYVHKVKAEEKQVIDKMMSAADLKDYEVIDLMTRNYDNTDPTSCITIGKVANRIVKNKLHAFPDFKEFTGALTKAKKALRQEVLVSLRELAEILKRISTNQPEEIKQIDEKVFEKPCTVEEFKKLWFSEANGAINYIIISSAEKRICIYNENKPDTKADFYYTVAEFAALLDLTEMFGAKNLLIYKENEKEGHEI